MRDELEGFREAVGLLVVDHGLLVVGLLIIVANGLGE